MQASNTWKGAVMLPRPGTFSETANHSVNMSSFKTCAGPRLYKFLPVSLSPLDTNGIGQNTGDLTWIDLSPRMYVTSVLNILMCLRFQKSLWYSNLPPSVKRRCLFSRMLFSSGFVFHRTTEKHVARQSISCTSIVKGLPSVTAFSQHDRFQMK